MNAAELFDTKRGPVVIMGNGPSLADIPDEFLGRFPTFGCNSVHVREGVPLSYWAGADKWVGDFLPDVVRLYPDIPKFFPTTLKHGEEILNPELARHFYDYRAHANPISIRAEDLHPEYLMNPGIAYTGITHAMVQMAFFMGHDEFYLVGCDNTRGGEHFYEDSFNDFELDPGLWEWAFEILAVCLRPCLVVNLSTRGEIKSLPWADWREL